MVQQKLFQDQEILTDMLSDQKQSTGLYNTYAGECVCQGLKSDMLNILRDEQSIQSSIFGEMHKRGWYEPAAAEQQQVNQTRQKFEGVAQAL
jgi:spore coat protein CotF